MIFLVRRAWMPGERTAAGMSHGRAASKNRENEGDAPESEKLGGALPARGISSPRRHKAVRH
ncbi:MAG: hypothetical protein CMI08_13940 [Oceanospirillaceae bacterium]|nr:hypothetical protein [Oceanospirillaceae bacterium]